MEYTDKVIEHFMCPQNSGNMPDADAVGFFGDPSCGDFLKIFIKVKNNTIEKISYLVYGCCAAVATSSMTTVLAKGKTLLEAEKITEKDVTLSLGGLPDTKLHCSNLGVAALRSAIENYKRSIKEINYENCSTGK